MTSYSLKSYLELKVIWKDNDMIELSIIASNKEFFGKTKVYDQAENLAEFAAELEGFPHNQKELFYDSGTKDSYAYFSMRYYPVDYFGYIGVEVNIESNVPTEYRQEEKNKLKLEIIVEPNAIDNFQKELLTMAKKEEGSAILYGQDNRIDD